MKTTLATSLALAVAAGAIASAQTIAPAEIPVPRYLLFWKERSDVSSPGPRYGHALAYDSDRGVTLFFGGEYSVPGGDPEYFNDTWEYDGVSWKRITIEGDVPEPRSRHAMCYDNVRRQVILYGGRGGVPNDVWNYESTGPQRGRWIRRAMSIGPGPLAGHTMTFDYFGGRAYVAGGNPLDSNDSQTAATWEWDNNIGEWFSRKILIGFYAGGLGQGLTDHMMLYDYRRHETVVLGGVGPYGTTLAANGRMFFVTGPREGEKMICGSWTVQGSIVYDGFHDIYFQFGGNEHSGGYPYPSPYATPSTGQIWYRGLNTFPCGYRPDEITVAYDYYTPVRPGPRAQCAMVYDEKRRVTIMFGGVGEHRYGDTWELLTQDSAEVWVDFSHTGREIGTFDFPFNSLAEGVSASAVGGILRIKGGSTPVAPLLGKAMTIEAFGGVVTIGRP